MVGHRKTTEKTTDALVRQPHGGALRTGGAPGNRGGSGRPRNEIRAAMRESLETRLCIAEGIADSPKSNNNDRLKALEFLARYGLGTTDTTKVESVGALHLAALRQLNAENRAADRIQPDPL